MIANRKFGTSLTQRDFRQIYRDSKITKTKVRSMAAPKRIKSR